MKLFYLAYGTFGCVAYAADEREAFDKMVANYDEILGLLDLPLDIFQWWIKEFTLDSFGGVLCFKQIGTPAAEYIWRYDEKDSEYKI